MQILCLWNQQKTVNQTQKDALIPNVRLAEEEKKKGVHVSE